jgi:hypothetical protein
MYWITQIFRKGINFDTERPETENYEIPKTNKSMKTIFTLFLLLFGAHIFFGQVLPPKQAYPFNIKQIHSGHSLTDPLFANWPGQYVNLIGIQNSLPAWQLFDAMVGKSTVPGSSLRFRWENVPGFGAPDARHQIGNWQLLSITERVPLNYQGGNSQQWYLDGIQEQKTFLSNFVNNAWFNGNNGNGAPTLLWTTWTNIDNSNGPWRSMLDIQGAEFEKMQDFANANRPSGAPPVYIIPGHKMMAKIFDDIALGLVPGITNINQIFSDNIHTNELGSYAISMIHYACIFNKSPEGLTNNLLPSNAPQGTPIPSPALALYLQRMIWNVVTSYPRTGVLNPTSTSSNESSNQKNIKIYPNPVSDFLYIERNNLLEKKEVKIFNSTGNLFFSSFDDKIDMSQFPSGIYFLSDGVESLKFVKVK